MALAAFVISAFLGLGAALVSSFGFGFGFLAAFGIYLGVSTILPVLALLTMIDTSQGTPEGGVLISAKA